jgi:hypothetical protein
MHTAKAASEADQKREFYEIRLKGHLSNRWADWFDGMTLKLEDNGTTLLTGVVVDQAALYSLLRKARDLGLPLLSVTYVDNIAPKQSDVSTVKL